MQFTTYRTGFIIVTAGILTLLISSCLSPPLQMPLRCKGGPGTLVGAIVLLAGMAICAAAQFSSNLHGAAELARGKLPDARVW